MKEIKIIYEDNDVLAVNKPAGLLVHGPDSLVDWLIKKYPEIKDVGEDRTRPGIVHRLDKDTSGVLLIAKNQKSFEFLKAQFKDRKIKKKYIALVCGNLKNKQGIIDLPIGKSKKDFRKKSSDGKLRGKIRDAVTEYKLIRRFPDYDLVEVSPKTGRTHQIRVHLKAIGHPVVCDKLYGFKKPASRRLAASRGGQICPFGLTRQFLHANSLEFALFNGSIIKLEADLPAELQNTLNMLNY